MKLKDRTVWIIGASTGIGRELAFELARRGARLCVSARSADKLQAIVKDLAGSGHRYEAFDAADPKAMAQAYQNLLGHGFKLDSAIYMAGQYAPAPIAKANAEDAQTIINVNLVGALNMVQNVLPDMLANKHGQIALCASVAGYRGLPNAQPYGATKAALINYAESLYSETMGRGLDIKVINPGFVKTPMTDKNDFPMPMMMSAEEAAVALADGLEGNGFEIHFPKKFTYLMKLLKFLPNAIYFRIVPR